MSDQSQDTLLEKQIGQWRNYLSRRQAFHSVDIAELEDHLREQISGLEKAGLATDEAFLISVKRMGDLDALAREFAREHSDRLWKQLVVVPSDDTQRHAGAQSDAFVAFAFAFAAALFIKLPAFFGFELIEENASFYMRNMSLFVLPLLTAYFIYWYSSWRLCSPMSIRLHLKAIPSY
jgi:hypothetical protein